MMRSKRKLGAVLVAAGFIFLLAAGGLLWFNQAQDLQAETASRHVLTQLSAQILQKQATLPPQAAADDGRGAAGAPGAFWQTDAAAQLPTVRIDGVDYIGVLSFPSLELELPVMAQWSYEGLRTAPGRFSGSNPGGDLVVAGHNYASHFGTLGELSAGDPVLFTDANGKVYRYAVLDIEILQPTDVDEMTAGDYPLTVFTCTYGGRTRLTIRCG